MRRKAPHEAVHGVLYSSNVAPVTRSNVALAKWGSPGAGVAVSATPSMLIFVVMRVMGCAR